MTILEEFKSARGSRGRWSDMLRKYPNTFIFNETHKNVTVCNGETCLWFRHHSSYMGNITISIEYIQNGYPDVGETIQIVKLKDLNIEPQLISRYKLRDASKYQEFYRQLK